LRQSKNDEKLSQILDLMKKPHQQHTQNILNHISNNYEEFTPSQRRVAQYIYDNAQELFDIES